MRFEVDRHGMDACEEQLRSLGPDDHHDINFLVRLTGLEAIA